MMKLKLVLLALLLSGCGVQFDPFNNAGAPRPEIVKAIEALNQFAVGVDARLKKLEPTPAPTAVVKK